MAEGGGAIPDFGSLGGNGKLPSMEELLAALDSMSELSEENKQELRESILRGGLAKQAENIAEAAAEKVGTGIQGEMPILFALIALVFMVLVFFGYKLYSSLMEKERRREEKKRQKQQKKKK